MAKYQTKAKTQKVYSKNRATDHIIPKNCVAVFPMLIVSGSTYITEHGTMPQNITYDKGSFLFWQEVFDGRSSIKIQWEDAILLEKPEGKNYYLADTHVGKYYYGKPISNSTESLEIGEDESYDEFITMKANQTVRIRFEFQKSNRLMFDNLKEDLRFADNDLYKLYLIPEICEGKLMYISDYEEGYEDQSGLSYWCEITFQSLGSELQKSGKAVEQYPQWSAPGEFYVKPKIEYSVGNVQEKRITIDQKGLNPIGVKYLQVELQGPALTSCMYALGRRQEKDPETGKWKIGPSHHLLGVNFVSTQPNPLNRTSVPTKNYDCFYDEEVCFASNAEFLQLLTDKLSQPLEQMKNGGLITLGLNTDWTNVASGIHKSNNPADNNDSRFDYYDTTWFPLSFLTSNPSINTNGCVYAEETIEYKRDNDRMIDIMNKNVFTFNQQPVIPLSMYATRPFYLRSIPLIGSIANFFSLGDIHLFNNTTNRKTSNLVFFGDADLMAMCANLQQGMIQDNWYPFKQQGKIAFPINFFGNNETSYNKLGVNSVNTTFCIELTDLVNIDSNTYNTVLLGQSTYEDGTPIFPDEPDKTLLVNGSMKSQEAINTNYIIDAVVVQTIFDGKIRLSCYTDQDNEFLIPTWTTTILSNASWQGGAMRDWTNMYILSNWTDRFCRQQDDFTWPLPPHKQSAEEVVLNVNINQNFDAQQLKGINPYWLESDWSKAHLSYFQQPDTYYTDRSANFSGTYEVAYTDLAIEGVNDKESFKNYFGNIQVNFQGSSARFYRDGSIKYNPTIDTLFNTIGSIGSADTYEYNCPVISVNNDYVKSWKDFTIPQADNVIWKFGAKKDPPELYPFVIINLGMTCRAYIKIELLENTIRISAKDISTFFGYGDSLRKAQEGDDCSITSGGNWNGTRLSYEMLFKQIRFVKRGNGTRVSNNRYGVNGTENH